MLPIETQHALIAQWSGLVPWALRRWPLFVTLLGYDDACSIANHALVKAASRFDPTKGKFSTWARHWIYRKLSHKARRTIVERVTLTGFEMGYFIDDASSGEVEVDVRQDIATALSVLPPVWVYILRRYYHEDALEKEIAQELGVTRAAISLIRGKALRYLRAWFDGEAPELRPADLANIARGRIHRHLLAIGKIPA